DHEHLASGVGGDGEMLGDRHRPAGACVDVDLRLPTGEHGPVEVLAPEPERGGRRSCASLPRLTSRWSPRGWTVTSSGAYISRRAYHSSLRRRSASTAAQEVTGQQSFSCHTMVP